MIKLLWLLVLIIGNVYALKPHTITYDLLINDAVIGSETRVMTKKNDVYTYVANAKTQGITKFFYDYKAKSFSKFVINDRLHSVKFSFQAFKNNKITKDINLTFSDNLVTAANNNFWQVEGVVNDNLNLILALSYDLKHNNKLKYLVADGKKIKNYDFSNLTYEKLEIFNELLDVIKVYNDDIIIYFAKDYDYLPIVIIKNDWQYVAKSFSFQ